MEAWLEQGLETTARTLPLVNEDGTKDFDSVTLHLMRGGLASRNNVHTTYLTY